MPEVLPHANSSLSSLQTAVVIVSVPVVLVMLGMCVAIWRQFSEERLAFVRAERQRRARQLTEQVSDYMVEQGMVEQPDGRHPRREPAEAGSGRVSGSDRTSGSDRAE